MISTLINTGVLHFSCKRIEGHKQEDVNTQSDIANMNEVNQRGIRELNSEGLIDTVEEIKNGVPDSQQKDLSSQLQRINLCFSKENTRTKQKPKSNSGGY